MVPEYFQTIQKPATFNTEITFSLLIFFQTPLVKVYHFFCQPLHWFEGCFYQFISSVTPFFGVCMHVCIGKLLYLHVS